jgi:hypothetical protein
MNPGSLENSQPWAAAKIFIPRDRQKIAFARAKYIIKYFANTSSGKFSILILISKLAQGSSSTPSFFAAVAAPL